MGLKKFFRYSLPLALIILSIVLVAVLVVIGKGKRPERKETANPAVLVEVIPARVVSLHFSVASQGTVRPRTQTTLVPQVSGRVISLSPNFIAGGFFKAGETLLQIDPSDYATAVARAEADLAAREAQYAEEKARSEQALRDWKNMGRPGKPPDLVLRKPQLDGALAAVQAAEAALQQARRNLERTRISVPYDGLVRSKQADVGQYVTPGTPLGVTFAINRAEIRLPLSGRDAAFLDLPSATRLEKAKRLPVRLTAEASGFKGTWQGEIVRTEGVLDEKSRMIYAVAEVDDPYGVMGRSQQAELRIGTFVRAEIRGRRADDVVVLPRSVLRPDDTVLIANEQNELEIRQVKVLRSQPRKVYISSGIETGERVVTTSIEAPVPGMRLAIAGEPRPGKPDDGAATADVTAVEEARE